MPLTKYEKETIINFNEGSQEASIFTYRKDWQKKLKSMGYKPDLVNSFGGKSYTVPKRLVVKPPQRLKRLSAKQKQNLSQRLPQTSNLRQKTPCAVG